MADLDTAYYPHSSEDDRVQSPSVTWAGGQITLRDERWSEPSAQVAADLRGRVPAGDLVPGEPEPGISLCRAQRSLVLSLRHEMAMAADDYCG
jgi:hypothetical protein